MKRFMIQEEPKGPPVCALGNFNPVALLSMILLVISLILACVCVGLDEWSRMDVMRGSTSASIDSNTYKTQGVAKRCVSYRLNEELLSLPLEQQPKGSCLFTGSLECSMAQSALESAHDNPRVNELQNTDNPGECSEVRTELQVSLAFMMIGIIGTAAAVVLLFPLWHMGVFMAGGILALAAFVAYVIAVGVFLGIDNDYGGFFSLNGEPSSGCLSYSFGLAVGAFLTNLMGGFLGIIAFVYEYRKKMDDPRDY